MTVRRYAEGTETTEENSRREIERTLTRYGADQVMLGYGDDVLVVKFRLAGRHIQRAMPIPPVTDKQFEKTKGGWLRPQAERRTLQAQERRRLYRVLLLWLKTMLELVESEAMTLDEAFLASIVLPNGSTAGEWLQPQIEAAYQQGTMPNLLPARRPRGWGKITRRLTRFSARRCVYCNRPFGPELPATLDHWIPLSHGGTNTRRNLLPACKECNTSKGGKEPHRWIEQTCPAGTLDRVKQVQRRAGRRR